MNSKRKPNLTETDREKDFNNKFFQDFLNKNGIKIYSRNIDLGAVSANALLVLLEIYLNDLFLKKEIENRLMYYLQ